MKICSKCKQEKSLNEFNKYKKSTDGFRPWCKDCQKEYRKKYSQTHQEERKRWRQKYKYNLKSSERLKMYINQDGCCAICRKPIPYSKICTDHNHKTGKVRGLLCQSCNIKLSALDNSNFLQAAVIYLGRSK